MSVHPVRTHPRRRTRNRLAGLALTSGLLVTGLLPGSALTADATAIVCAPGVNVFVWDGSANDTAGHVGDGKDWADAYNWDVDCTPGLRFQPHDDDVTIPSTAKVTISDGESAQVAALHNNGNLIITPGGTLQVFGASQSKTMTLQGTLAGPGSLTVTSALKWIATPQGGSTIESRWCFVEDPCNTPAPTKGVTVINLGATLSISGRGVNLEDQAIIENHGTTKLSGAGYIAADYGTQFRNLRLAGQAAPKFVIANQGGYYQGFLTAGFSVSTFANTGKVTKTAGGGVSIIDANFTTTDSGSPYTGTVEVHSGTLSLFTPTGTTSRTAKVQQGTRFANGGPDNCDPVNDPPSCRVVQPTADDPDVTSVEITTTGTATSAVTIQDVPSDGQPGDRGVPVQIDTPNAVATTTNPLRFRLMLDSTLLHSGETAAGLAASITVRREATTSDPYVVLPNCDGTQNPTNAVPVCVARTMSVTETNDLGTGDVVVVISSLLNSRYRI